MERKRTAAIFPAFGCRYLGIEQDILNDMSGDLRELLSRAEAAVAFDRDEFLSQTDGNFTDELQSQYAAYIISCAFSNILKRNGVRIDYAAGYSMGLYAAIFHAESVTFEQGLELITVAYTLIREAAAGLDFGTGVISGLEEGDVRSIITGTAGLEIININSRHSLMIAGASSAVTAALAAAKGQGALNTKYLALKLPYHSHFMKEAARRFYDYCSGMTIYDPSCRIISTLDGRVLTTWEGVVGDLAGNIDRNIHWLRAMERMIAAGVDVFFECGPGRSLSRIARFIDGDFTVYGPGTMNELLASGRACGSARALNFQGV